MRRLPLLAISFLSVLLPLAVFAHGTSYLEFNPDKSSSLKDADVATPSQAFFAQNDFLSGFDIWVANSGLAGTATFSLLNEQGIVLTTKTVTIPTFAITSNGARFHVDFNSQLPVLADKKYSILLTTSMPELRLYYSDRVRLISHNAPPVSEYLTGVAKLGSEEQIFSFKYALYETNETSAPIISNVGWTVISSDQMRVDFNANEAVDYKIEYGPSGGGYTQSTNFLGDYEFCISGIAICSIDISVSAGTAYQYALTVKDTWGNQSQVTGAFTSGQAQTPAPTPVPTDLPPTISNFRVVDLTNNSASFAWTTNEITNAHLLISFSSYLIAIDAVSDQTFELEHFLETNPILGPNTNYLATVTSRDLGNNSTQASISFTTLSYQPTPSPLPSSSPTPFPLQSSPSIPSGSPVLSPISSTPPPQTTTNPQQSSLPQQGVTTSGIDNGTGTISWSVPAGGEPSGGYRVDIFDKDGSLVKSVLVEPGSHSTEITGLDKEGEYKVIVYENNNGVFKKLDKPKELKKEESFAGRLLAFWWTLVPLGAGLGYVFWKNYKVKSRLSYSNYSN